MKFTRSWLGDHLDSDAANESIAERLTMLGLEVEEVANPAAGLGAFSIAEVVEAVAHPNADTLRVCKVRTGGGEASVVCGAPNARAGMRGVFAPPGCVIPGTGKRLAAASIRGVESEGMLCSEFELGMSDEHDAVIELDEDAPVGGSFAEYAGLDDAVFHVNLTPNRPDCLGVRGIARDLAAAGVGVLREPEWAREWVGALEGAGAFACPVEIKLEFEAEDAAACSLFVARYVRGVSNRPSPAWMQRRLRAIGLRPIDALVDVTNYVAYDRARPLHVYDADKLRGAVRARLGREGERFDALDGKQYEVDADMCVIADEGGVLGLGGIIGGESSAVSAETRNVLVESAYFEPARIHRSGRRLGIASDARHRFERGVDAGWSAEGCDLGAAMILALCGGEVSARAQAGSVPAAGAAIFLPRGECKRITGCDFSAEEIGETLGALGFAVESEGEGMRVAPPSWRPDVGVEMGGAADLVEEVLRVRGVERVASVRLPPPERLHAVLPQEQKRARLCRRALAGRGMMEAVLYSFQDEGDAALFAEGEGEAVRLANPISAGMGVMRSGLLAGLTRALQRNLDRGAENLALFETGHAWRGAGEEEQSFRVAGVRHGLVGGGGRGRDWRVPGRTADVFDAKADACAVLEVLGAPMEKLRCEAKAPGFFHPGRSGVLFLDPRKPLAWFGALHPAVSEEMGIAGAVAAFELFVEALPSMSRRRGRGALRLSDLPLARRDFAFVVGEEVGGAELLRAVRSVDKDAVAEARLFDVFTGGDVGEGKKSLAVEVVFRPGERTFRDEEIRALCDKVVAAAAALGGVLRGEGE